MHVNRQIVNLQSGTCALLSARRFYLACKDGASEFAAIRSKRVELDSGPWGLAGAEGSAPMPLRTRGRMP